MTDYRFERECRTPFSEAYLITADDSRVGRVDLHYTSTVVHGILSVAESLTSDDIRELIDAIDEELVMSAEVAREDFVITVFQGRETGVFSDQDFEEEEAEDEEDESL